VPLRRLGRCTKFAWERTPNLPRLVLRKCSAMFPDCESRAGTSVVRELQGTSVVIDNKTRERYCAITPERRWSNDKF
jgi:hypothetical protein